MRRLHFRILEMTCRRTGFWLTSNGQSPRQTTSDRPSPCSPRCEGRPTESAEILGRPADCRGRRRLFRTYVLKQIYLTGCFKNVCIYQTVFFFLEIFINFITIFNVCGGFGQNQWEFTEKKSIKTGTLEIKNVYYPNFGPRSCQKAEDHKDRLVCLWFKLKPFFFWLIPSSWYWYKMKLMLLFLQLPQLNQLCKEPWGHPGLVPWKIKLSLSIWRLLKQFMNSYYIVWGPPMFLNANISRCCNSNVGQMLLKDDFFHHSKVKMTKWMSYRWSM